MVLLQHYYRVSIRFLVRIYTKIIRTAIPLREALIQLSRYRPLGCGNNPNAPHKGLGGVNKRKMYIWWIWCTYEATRVDGTVGNTLEYSVQVQCCCQRHQILGKHNGG